MTNKTKATKESVKGAMELTQFKKDVHDRLTDFFISDSFTDDDRAKEDVVQKHASETSGLFVRNHGAHGMEKLGSILIDVLNDIKYAHSVPMTNLDMYIRHMAHFVSNGTTNTKHGIAIENTFKIAFGNADNKKDKEIAHLTWAFKNMPIVYMIQDQYVPLFVCSNHIRNSSNKDNKTSYYAIGFLNLNDSSAVVGIENKQPAMDKTYTTIHNLVTSYKQFRASVMPCVMATTGRYIPIKYLTEEVCGLMKYLTDMPPGSVADHKTNPLVSEEMLTADDLPPFEETEKKPRSSGTSKKPKLSEFVEEHATDNMVVA
jgi:hypothetical protein